MVSWVMPLCYQINNTVANFNKNGMKNIDIFSNFKFSEIVGPIGTIKRILQNRSFFISHDCDITVYNSNAFFQLWDETVISNKERKSNWRSVIKNRLDNLAQNCYLLSVLLVEFKFLQNKRKVTDYIRFNRHPDVISFHSEIPCYYYLKKNKNHNIKTVLFFHNDGIPFKMLRLYYPKLEGTKYLQKMLDRYEYTVNHVDRCVFICKSGMEYTNRLYDKSITKSSLVVNGIDDLNTLQKEYIRKARVESRPNNIIRLCCVGSVSVRKGQRNVIEALGKLDKNQRRHYQLTIVGNGTDLNYCKTLVKNLQLEEVVNFPGAVVNKDVYKYLATADVFVLLSKNEGMPISIIEAMRASLAVISTKVSGIPEMVDEKNGVLIEPTSEALYRILSNGVIYNWKEMGEESRKRYIKYFTFDRMRDDYVKMIENTVNEIR